ncbi:hypothetical protein [Streptomyces sp. SID13726]|uniref:hypothetical protein n=1 Tax=Streptomyces sp. SID13726 TaxID=2706058 RepID=UPI001941B8FF|nr:hypothetical protein [Streptomyces sp. SID13726]
MPGPVANDRSGPFLLVGHGAGGSLDRLAAARAPRRIAGLVRVDPTDETGDVPFAGRFRRRERIVLNLGGAATLSCWVPCSAARHRRTPVASRSP